MFESTNLQQEAVQLGIAKDNFDRFKENIYIQNMEKIADEIDMIGKFLDLSASKRREAEHSHLKDVDFWKCPEEAALLEQMRLHCPNIFLKYVYTIPAYDLKNIEDLLHSHLTNDCNARQTQLQTMFAQNRFQSNAIFDCMASIVKRCSHSMQRIIANFAHR